MYIDLFHPPEEFEMPDPKFVYTFIMDLQTQRVLLANYYTGGWSLPGGLIPKGFDVCSAMYHLMELNHHVTLLQRFPLKYLLYNDDTIVYFHCIESFNPDSCANDYPIRFFSENEIRSGWYKEGQNVARTPFLIGRGDNASVKVPRLIFDALTLFQPYVPLSMFLRDAQDKILSDHIDHEGEHIYIRADTGHHRYRRLAVP